MKAYLKDPQTRLWYAGPDQWVVSRKTAVSFDVLQEAETTAATLQAEHIELVLTDGGANGETVIPLRTGRVTNHSG